jgi:hypothetical protein
LILMSSTSSINHHDDSRCTAWDYVKPENANYEWISRLRNMNSRTNEDDFTVKPFKPPKGLQMSACGKCKSLVAEFYSPQDGRNSRWNYEEQTVWKVLYDDGPHRVLQPRRPVDAGKLRCK